MSYIRCTHAYTDGWSARVFDRQLCKHIRLTYLEVKSCTGLVMKGWMQSWVLRTLSLWWLSVTKELSQHLPKRSNGCDSFRGWNDWAQHSLCRHFFKSTSWTTSTAAQSLHVNSHHASGQYLSDHPVIIRIVSEYSVFLLWMSNLWHITEGASCYQLWTTAWTMCHIYGNCAFIPSAVYFLNLEFIWLVTNRECNIMSTGFDLFSFLQQSLFMV